MMQRLLWMSLRHESFWSTNTIETEAAIAHHGATLTSQNARQHFSQALLYLLLSRKRTEFLPSTWNFTTTMRYPVSILLILQLRDSMRASLLRKNLKTPKRSNTVAGMLCTSWIAILSLLLKLITESFQQSWSLWMQKHQILEKCQSQEVARKQLITAFSCPLISEQKSTQICST